MTFPNFKDKYKEKAVFSPVDFIDYKRNKGLLDGFTPPEGVILCYAGRLLRYVTENYTVTAVKSVSEGLHLIKETDNRVGITGNFGIGAPVAVAIVDELIALGVKKFISIGMAGTLQKDINIGDIVVCDKAIRDEGTSYHYVKPSKYAFASEKLTSRIRQVMDTHGYRYITGSSWTVDAPYRETVAEAGQYQSEGVATVEMEASALFSVAAYRNVEMGAIFAVSDSLAEFKWSPEFLHRETGKGLETVCRVAIEALAD